MTQQRFAYKSSSRELHRVNYSLEATATMTVGYRVIYKEGADVSEQLVYLASKGRQAQASDVVAKITKSQALRLVEVRYA